MAERKERMSLLSRYSQLHFARYGARPTHNINAEQWAADSLIESYGLPGCYDLLSYYFEASQNPSWKYFANYAEKVLEAKDQLEQDTRERRERLRMARAWLNE
jgi:hypothetical protein